MPPATQRVLVSLFNTPEQAKAAVMDLEKSGFTLDEMGYALRGRDEGGSDAISAAVGSKDEHAAATGAVAGGVLGGLFGAAAALLIPGVGPVLAAGILTTSLGYAAAGVAVGGIVGAFTAEGISEDEARFYESEFKAGKAIVTVRSGLRDAAAWAILARHGGFHQHSVAKDVAAPASPQVVI